MAKFKGLGNVSEMMAEAYGYAVLPTIGKAGMGIGGATAVALTYGAQAGASTQGASASAGDTKGKGMWKRGMAVFTLAKGGLMY